MGAHHTINYRDTPEWSQEVLRLTDGRGVGHINPLPLITRAIRLNGVYVGSHAMFANMNKAISTHQLKPIIDRTFSFDQVADAYAWLRSGSHFGKVVITVNN